MLKRFLTVILVLIFTLAGIAHAAAPQCADLFRNERRTPTRGSNLRPIELIRNLKQNFLPSKIVRKFDQKTYEEHFTNIKSHNLKVESGFRPKSLEEAVAYLDVQLESISISVSDMPPVLRHQTYKTVMSSLKSQGSGEFAAEGLAQLIFRGNYAKPTSFKYLLTHLPPTVGREIFIQNLHALHLTDIVKQAYDYNSGPKKPSLLKRLTPQLLKDHRELITASLWGGVSVYGTVQSHSIDSFFLPAFNILKTKNYKSEIERTYIEVGLEGAIQKLEPQYQNANALNAIYAVIEKGMNWYFFLSIFSVFASDTD